MDINHRIRDNISKEDILLLEKELDHKSWVIFLRHKEIILVKILNYLSKLDSTNKIIIFNDDEGYELTIKIKVFQDEKEKIDCSNYLTEIFDDISEQIKRKLFIGQPYKFEFINDESGKNQLLKYMIGSHWELWKKEGEMMMLHEKIEKETSNNNQIKIVKSKI